MAIETDRLISAAPTSLQEEAFERALRPKSLSEYIGQEKIRGQLAIFVEAARNRKEALDHVLLYGPPGLGKTTLAHIIAREMGVNLRQTAGPGARAGWWLCVVAGGGAWGRGTGWGCGRRGVAEAGEKFFGGEVGGVEVTKRTLFLGVMKKLGGGGGVKREQLATEDKEVF